MKNDFHLVIICGPPASGKMTVGQELQKRTGYKLFYNHMSLELVNQFFDFNTEHFNNLDKHIRFSIFKEIAKSTIPGLIFTLVWAFDLKEDEEYIQEIISVFENRNLRVSIIELDCKLEERLRRNKTENRLKHKASKRDLEFSDKLIMKEETLYPTNTLDGEFEDFNILKIENTHKSALEVAERIQNHFKSDKKTN